MDGLPLIVFAIVGLATCGLGALASLALFLITIYRYLSLEMIAYSKEIADAKKAASITHEPKIPVSPPQGPGV
jgi:hypothetical protein